MAETRSSLLTSAIGQAITGALHRDGGEILFDGRQIDFATPQEAQNGGISTIYQEINLVPFRSVAENIFLGREPRRWGFINWPAVHASARDLLGRLGIRVDVRRPLMTYSTAIQQMVAIARALSFRAKLVIMDEPTSSLAEHEVETLFGVIRQLKAEGVAVIFVSHKLDELYAVCDRITVMRDGRTVMACPMAEVSKLDLVSAMLGRAQVAAGKETAFEVTDLASGPTLIEAEGLSVGQRVRDARLAVRKGEIVGLAGLLGSGRTEVARMLFGADRPDAGTIKVEGAPVAFRSPQDAIARGLGFCTEDRKVEGIVPEMSVRENLTLALLPRLAKAGIVDEEEQRRIVTRFIARLGIKTAGPEQRIRELSGGNQQKVLLARWLCMQPRLLILDEPTRGIDVGAKAEIQKLIDELAREGLGVLMISSELEEITEGADRVFVLRDGRTVAELGHHEATEANILAAMADAPEPVAQARHD
jgi:ribose transport system ATP-binding protein